MEGPRADTPTSHRAGPGAQMVLCSEHALAPLPLHEHIALRLLSVARAATNACSRCNVRTDF